MTTNSNIDWNQVIVNLSVQLESDYSYGLYHDLMIARSELAKQERS